MESGRNVRRGLGVQEGSLRGSGSKVQSPRGVLVWHLHIQAS